MCALYEDYNTEHCLWNFDSSLSEYYVILSGFDIKLDLFFPLPFIMTTKAYSDIVMYMFLDYGVRWDQ